VRLQSQPELLVQGVEESRKRGQIWPWTFSRLGGRRARRVVSGLRPRRERIPLHLDVEDALNAGTIDNGPVRIAAQDQCQVIHIDAIARKASRTAREAMTFGRTGVAVPIDSESTDSL